MHYRPHRPFIALLVPLLLAACNNDEPTSSSPLTPATPLALQINPAGGHTATPEIAVDARGNALAVWAQHNGTAYSLYARHYRAGAGWGSVQPLESETSDAHSPQAAFDAFGNAMVVWNQSDGTQYNIMARRFRADGTWEGATLVENDAGDTYGPQVALDGNGTAFVVWYQRPDANSVYDIKASRHSAASGWDAPILLETLNGVAYRPMIAVSANGSAMATWEQHDGIRINVQAKRYVPGTGWGAASGPLALGTASNPRVGMDAQGNATLIWEESDGARWNVQAKRYLASSGWVPTRSIDTDDTYSAYVPRLAVDPAGNATIVWLQANNGLGSIWARRYTATQDADTEWTGLGSLTLLEDDDVNAAVEPEVAMDASGNAVAVWAQRDGTDFRVYARRYTVGQGWSSARRIDETDSGNHRFPFVSMNAAGEAFATWSHYPGSGTNVWVRRGL